MFVEIVDYKRSWPSEFRLVAEELRRALGDLSPRIDHIGSTSVPGLSAKDCIDVQVTVAATQDFASVHEKVVGLGYEHAPENNCDHVAAGDVSVPEQWEKRFYRAASGKRRVHIHVRVDGHANQRYALLFRDYLRVSGGVAASYERLKREIVRDQNCTIDRYVAIKDPACDIIIAAARRWAQEVDWRPGPPDA